MAAEWKTELQYALPRPTMPCLANTQVLQACLQAYDSGDNKAQRWIVEAGDEPNVVAFKNLGSGTYLNAQRQGNGGVVRAETAALL